MEKYAIWFWLLLKSNIKKKSTWLQCLMLIILLLFIQSIKFPAENNVTAGICFEDDVYAEKIFDSLKAKNSVYNFQKYKDEEKLERDVKSGVLECGFIFEKDFEENFSKGELYKIISCIVNPFSVKGELLQENVYVSVLEVYSEELLKQAEEELYPVPDEERIQKILAKNEEYLNSSDLFSVKIENVVSNQEEMDKKNITYPLQGTFGTFLFLLLFFSYGKNFEAKGNGFRTSLGSFEKNYYDFIQIISSGLVTGIAGTVCIIFSVHSRGVFSEAAGFLCYLVMCAAWIIFFGNFVKKELNFYSGMILIMVLTILVCPIFWDISVYIPALKFLKYIFPIGIYLSF